VESSYSKSSGYLNQLAQFAASLPEKMDWKSSSSGILSVSSQLKEMFAIHLGKAISKVFWCLIRELIVDGLSFLHEDFYSEGSERSVGEGECKVVDASTNRPWIVDGANSSGRGSDEETDQIV
jgi:hypothetical protein